MLAELAAANAAFAIIKTTIANGRELASAGKAIASFVHAEEELKSRGTKKKNSFWRKVGGKEGSDLEEFMALEEIRTKKKQLEEIMVYYGRAGLYQDWVRFQKDARVRRQREAEELKRKRKELFEILAIAGLSIVGGGVVIFFAFFILLATRG